MFYFIGVDDGDGFKFVMWMFIDVVFFVVCWEGVWFGIVEQ